MWLTRLALRNPILILMMSLMVITLGVVDAARIFSAWVSITNGAREGALYATTGNNPTHWCAPIPSSSSTSQRRHWMPSPSTW